MTAFAGFLPESEEMNLEWSKQLIAEYVLLWKKIENVWRRVTLGKKQEKTELTKMEWCNPDWPAVREDLCDGEQAAAKLHFKLATRLNTP